MIRKNVSLKQLNTFGIDAKADYFTSFNSIPELEKLRKDPIFNTSEKLILGGGSNLLFTKDFKGLVIKNETLGIEKVKEDSEHLYIKAGAGVQWHSFVMYCIENGWAGLENLSLIPGKVGASPMQNIGAYGVEIKDVFESLEAYHIKSGQVKCFSASECKFGYRESIFKKTEKGNYIILNVTFRLNKFPSINTRYGAIEDELKKMGVSSPGIKEISEAVIRIRKSKLPDPNITGNAGSFFKNPLVSRATFEKLSSEYPGLVGYNVSDKEVKLAAGWLIESCGLKGFTKGKCGVHKLQALVLVNYGGASGQEIFDLSSYVLETVKNKFGVELEREVNII